MPIFDSITSEYARKKIIDYIRKGKNTARIDHNRIIFQILEGDIRTPLSDKLLDDLGETSYAEAKHRMAPVNYYRKVIDKLTMIYNHKVVREVVKSNDERDQELLEWYESVLKINSKMNDNNENFNAYKYSLIHFTINDENTDSNEPVPFMRSIPNHEFLVMNVSKVDPTSPDIIIVFHGKYWNEAKKRETCLYYVYTNTEFMIIDEDGDIRLELMEAYGIEDFKNDFGTYPFVYVNGSSNLVMPLIQTDDLSMALLGPMLLTDLNYSAKFQAFSMYYGIDVDDQDIRISPNSFLSLKSDPGGEKPEFGVVKPTIDTQDTLTSASSQISLWLTSKGLKPGAIADMTRDQFASGISKMIDEGDTFESRVKQIRKYKEVEHVFWNKILKVYHPAWVANGLVSNRHIFSADAEVVTVFPEPKPLQTRLDIINELTAEMEAGLESRMGAMKRLYPDMSDQEIIEKLAEIDANDMFNRMFEVQDNGQEQDRDAATA